jgi:hypothetical protein
MPSALKMVIKKKKKAPKIILRISKFGTHLPETVILNLSIGR